METFMGYERPDGTAGIRNHVAVMATVSCANGVVQRIAREVPGVIPFMHTNGCGRGGSDLLMHSKTLQNLCRNPNIGGLLIIGLGCEYVTAESLHLVTSLTGKPCEKLVIQESGGSAKTAELGASIARKLIQEMSRMKPVPLSFDRLTVGLECGGSDAFSGLTANPAIGVAADWIIDRGGRAVLTEVTEMKGTNRILMDQASCEDVARQIDETIRRTDAEAEEILGDFAKISISPGNMDGGMSSVLEKSLGCIVKGGARPITEVVEYGAIPAQKGRVIMDGPGYDTESMTGLAASGCQIILFSPGRGTPVGFPAIPVVKISSNSELYRKFSPDIDVNAGMVLEGKSIADVGNEIIDFIRRVASGEKTKAELNGQEGILCMYSKHRSF
jgi:altronate dehydratase large subunit